VTGEHGVRCPDGDGGTEKGIIEEEKIANGAEIGTAVVDGKGNVDSTKHKTAARLTAAAMLPVLP
jgi:hypothetical protein